LSKAPGLLAHLCMLAGAVALSIGIFLSTQPLLAKAQPPYAVTSAQDFPKLPASGIECKSTQVPNNPCTLRAAIETANTAASGATINVPGNFVITLDPALGELSLTVAMSITSFGPGSATVDGALQTRVFHIMNGTTGVTMSGLTVRHGKVIVGSDHSAAGIWNEGSLTLNNVVVTLNEGKNAAGIGDLGTLTVNGGSISGNTAAREQGSNELAVAGGLGVKAGGVAVVNGTSFVNNSAEVGGGIGTLGRTTLLDVTLTNNTASQGGGGLVVAPPSQQFPVPEVQVTNCSIRGNTTGGVGGGILLASGHLTMVGSTISGNNAPAGSGGGMFAVGSSATLTNDTLSGNIAAQNGGGIAQSTNLPVASTRGGALSALAAQVKPARAQRQTSSSQQTAAASGVREAVGSEAGPDDISLGWVTLAGNSAQTGGGVSNAAGLAFTARDTIVAGNTGAGGANCSGSATSGGYNLESGSDCGFNATGDRSSSDPKLGGLANNGGLTETMALQTGSAAIDAADPDCPPPASDQRGVKRPQGADCDIGAFESTTPIPAAPSTGRSVAQRDGTVSLVGLIEILRSYVRLI
jgi:hypothetical protein